MSIVDARSLPDGAILDTDVCVVGAGAAGCTLAGELSHAPLRTCVIESGGLRMDAQTQSLAAGEVDSAHAFPLDETQVRGFGGTTAIWAGSCRPLDQIDFEPRSWLPFSGWPVSRAQIDPYYLRAQSVCQIGPGTYDVEAWEDAERPHLPLHDDRIVTHIFQISPPTRFAKAYFDAIRQAPTLRLLMYANVLEIETTPNGQSATAVKVGTLRGTRFTVSAKVVVVAGGAIENARLLLLSNQVKRTGLGNDHDLVGRFFMDHPRVESTELLVNPRANMALYAVHRSPRSPSRVRIEGLLAVADPVLEQEHMLRCAFQVPPAWRSYSEFHTEGVMALRQAVRALRARDIPYRWSARLRTIVRERDAVILTLLRRFTSPRNHRTRFVLTTCSEQAPNPDSRVTLAESRDRFGRRRARLGWRLSEIDHWTIRRGNEVLAADVEASGVGTLRQLCGDQDPKLRGGFHNMGTTRMHASPTQGVVDANCRVHGMSNLYVAGASTFPTGGYANPTLTIVALALRLADHIRAQFC